MVLMETGYLLKDIFPLAHRGKQPYAKQGAKVTITSDRGTAYLVEDASGERFPVDHSEIKIINE